MSIRGSPGKNGRVRGESPNQDLSGINSYAYRDHHHRVERGRIHQTRAGSQKSNERFLLTHACGDRTLPCRRRGGNSRVGSIARKRMIVRPSGGAVKIGRNSFARVLVRHDIQDPCIIFFPHPLWWSTTMTLSLPHAPSTAALRRGGTSDRAN